MVNATQPTGTETRLTVRPVKLLSVVMPAHDEADCIADTIGNVSRVLKEENIRFELLVIDDHSTDNTKDLLARMAGNRPWLRPIKNRYPGGFGLAIRCGLEQMSGDAAAIVMADGSDAPEDIVAYYRKLEEGFDCVFGSRFIKGSRLIDYPVHKLVVNRMANLFIRLLFGLRFNDTTNAFKAYRKEVIEGIFPVLSNHFNLTVELPLKAIIRGYTYAVIPIGWRNRATGISKLKIKEMGSRYLFIVLYAWLEKTLSKGDYVRRDRGQNQKD